MEDMTVYSSVHVFIDLFFDLFTQSGLKMFTGGAVIAIYLKIRVTIYPLLLAYP